MSSFYSLTLYVDIRIGSCLARFRLPLPHSPTTRLTPAKLITHLTGLTATTRRDLACTVFRVHAHGLLEDRSGCLNRHHAVRLSPREK